jgi:hypothetical protein
MEVMQLPALLDLLPDMISHSSALPEFCTKSEKNIIIQRYDLQVIFLV